MRFKTSLEPGPAARTPARRITIGAAAVGLSAILGACSEPAREELGDASKSLNQAGEAIDSAIRQSAQDVKPQAREAGQEMMESLSDVRAKLEQTGQAVDQVAGHVSDEVTGDDDDKLDPDAVVCEGERYSVTREVAREVAGAPMALALEAGVEETERGAKITAVQQGGILARLGLRKGDVVVGVAGLDLDGPMDQPLSERLLADEVTVTIERDGERIDKVITVAPAPTTATPGA